MCDIRGAGEKLVFHIGFGKTGTTTIQKFLRLNFDLFNSFDFFFYTKLGPESQIWLPFLLFDNDNPRDY